MRAFVTRNLPDAALAPIRAVAEVDVWEDENPPPYDLLRRRTADCDGLLCLLTDRIDGALLTAAPRLRVVSQMAVGVDNIDLAECRRRSIPVGHTPGVLTETVADLAFALILATARRLVEADRFVREGAWTTWSPMLLVGPDVHHATLGIIGMGRIGFETARRGSGFSMRIAYTARHAHAKAESELGAVRMDLPGLFAASDFVSLHIPLTPETRHMINAASLAQMKPTAILINTARGGVVDTNALVQALEAGTIAGAGLDVFEEEPLAPGHPLTRMRSVTLLPHIGSASVATRTRMAVMAAENLVAGLRGEPLPHAVPAGG